MIKKIAKTLKNILPVFIYNGLRLVYNHLKPFLNPIKKAIFRFKLKKVRANHDKALKELRKKEKIKVAFFLIHESVWKYDGVYKLMENDERFDPIVIVCPYITYGKEHMLQDMKNSYNAFKQKGYNVIKTLKEDGSWLGVKKEIKPDIVFFTNPHKLTRDEYYITNFLDTLTCYVPYNFGNSHRLQVFHNKPFHNYLWRLFAETDMHKEYSVNTAFNKGGNVCVTGFPGTDIFLNNDYLPRNVWKNNSQNKKKIIWAPHHTIDDDKSLISFSSFLLYSDIILDLAVKFSDEVQFAFKPHPLLKLKLEFLDNWGKERTEKYYETWDQLDNGQLVEGDYTDLFITSDAMIHDSGSFLIEYLYTLKPVLRTDRDDSICDRLNSFAVKAYNLHYIAKNSAEIEKFIVNVLNNIDPLKERRYDFLYSELVPPNNRSASENIIQEINNYLK